VNVPIIREALGRFMVAAVSSVVVYDINDYYFVFVMAL
jgi:hypothetical protein